MNHGIKVIRHKTIETMPLDQGHKEGCLYAWPGGYDATDEEIVATVLCQRLHDDNETAEMAKGCHTIHVAPPGYVSDATLLMQPDPQCIVKRTAFLRRWNGVTEPEAIVCDAK